MMRVPFIFVVPHDFGPCFLETPQSICFLECNDLIHIRDILENINCERDDGTDLVCRAVDSFLSRTRVKEKIDFDREFSVLLVDKRLLKSNCVPFDDVVTINVLDPDKHYANAQAKGDDIISWLVDDPSVDKIFPRPIREHNLDIWLAVPRAVQFTLRDVLGRASHPIYDFSTLEDCLNLIRERKSLSDDLVLESILILKLMVTYKGLLMDSWILRIDNSRTRLLDNLTRLPVFDNRTYMLRLLKPFMLAGIQIMEPPAKSDAAEADVLLKESLSEKKKKNKNRKRPSTSMPRPLDKIVEHEPSVNLAPEGTSPSLEMVKEVSVDPEEDTLASDNQEEASKVDHDMPKMHEEDSLPKHLDSALGEAVATYNYAFDMTLKALLNTKVLKEDLKHNGQPFHGEQVPCSLQNFFTDFGAEKIKEDGIYRVRLSDLLASLKEVNPMSNDAAEVGSCEEEHICLAYEKTRWFNLRRESFEGEVVGNWKNVVKFCEERKVRPEILLIWIEYVDTLIDGEYWKNLLYLHDRCGNNGLQVQYHRRLLLRL
ncbi:hypothetical protein AALP_AAs65508U000100 [Arabis alpina]|uniref:DUF629 domain-containing protein n=1 Tax=Arabis alpina TaxID=50452 RepID=A0A087G227_ARAAL|nr:hypothetical protein AALP_AAs65508U000100 [Arabis alpina]